jgi:integrase
MSTRRGKPAPSPLTLGSNTTSLVKLVLAELPSPETRRSYARSITALDTYAEGRPLTLTLLLEWRAVLAAKFCSGGVNVRIAAIKKLIRTARRTGLIDAETASELLELKGMPYRGTPTGNWLSLEQARALLAAPNRKTLRGRRNYCILAIMIGCGLRRSEVASLTMKHIQEREGRPVILNLVSKAGRVRTVPIPDFVKVAIDEWIAVAKINSGLLIRRTTLAPEGLSTYALWHIVHQTAAKIGIENLGPHDLRRTCAGLCFKNGGEIQQIQFMLGHASIVTTQRYLGSIQGLYVAVNDFLGLDIPELQRTPEERRAIEELKALIASRAEKPPSNL